MQQLALSFEPGLATRFDSLRECVATQVYQRGLVAIAGKIDCSPSHLTEKLAGCSSDGKPRGMNLDELERYIAKTGDVTPVLYLAARYCADARAVQDEAYARLAAIVESIPGLLKTAGAGRARR